MGSLENRNVVVIGGTSGIGLATAIAAQTEGANVWAASRSKDKVTSCAEQFPDINFSQLDIHDVAALSRLFESIGAIDHIVAAATGANRTMAPFMDQTDDEFREAFNKFWGYTHVARQGIPHLSETGSVTFVSGTPARKCNPGMSSVSCTGSAVEGLTRALALEVAPVRVNAVAPGLIETGMFEHLKEKPEVLEGMGRSIPLGRVGQPEEVASAIILTMTNSYLTGTTIDVDGGVLLP
ncbi:MAG: SDR family oxidoreductase [Gammaproteobacteria bacterium]|jgi:NAD(P)-dependent dehydrogenase (short-subunit alcohol dehydrogenase family)|nr:SDR family oxidoreductase [Gammaproteobacteria bacterium]MBT4492839.1 SDR family oxidoreductase [Gammaproteobacteria bacterium]MBT7369882.1 SDR family oxidoreductase [Gammaproteobacteria bacterium]